MLGAMTRRRALAGLAACCGLGEAWAAPGGFPDDVSLLVAGPSGGRAARWGELMAPALGRALQQGAALPRQNVGGPDGVTGANQFDAHANPDGSTALLVPGQAALSWLCGDTRVKFDAGRWVPVWAGSTSAALATRVKLVPGQTVRVAVGNLIGPELAGLLALDLLGIGAVPVRIDGAGPSPLRRPDVDAVVLRGPALRA
ncbi:MAG TPA: hypothetical protein VE684_09765, partial [Crenalkalicoccus sp.]|nr:hypothetical protein [Crenalkalicoccus sp.]